MVGLRGAVAPDAGPVPAGGPRDLRDPARRGRARHAARRRHRRAADDRRARGRGDHRPRRPAGDARRPRGQVDRRDHAAQHGLLDGRRRLPDARPSSSSRASARASSSPTSPSSCSTSGRSTSTTSTRSRASAAARTRTCSATGSSGPGDQAFFDIIHTFVGYKTCYYRTFVVGHGKRRPARRVQAGTRVDRRLDRAHAAGRRHRPGGQRLAQGRGVRVLERDGVLRAPVRPQRRPVPPRAPDHQPPQLARAPGGAEGGHGHRPRDVLPGQGRLLGGADRGGGRDHGRRPAGDHEVPVARAVRRQRRTEAPPP